MRIWGSIEEVAISLERDADYHEREAGLNEKVLAADGDCRVVSG